MDLSDYELLHRFTHQRDAEAFAALVARHGPMVLAACRRVLRDGHEAEDALQATFLILVRKAGTIREREIMGHWLYRVAVNVARRLRRRQEHGRAVRRAAALQAEAGGAGNNEIETAAVAAELRPMIDAELAAMPAEYREVVVLCYLQERTYEEAAAALHLTPDAVRGRLARARDLLRSRLGRRGLAVTALVLGLALAPATAPAAVSAELSAATAQMALAWAAGTVGAAAALPVELGREVLWKGMVAKVTMVAGLGLAVAMMLGTGVWAGQRAWRGEAGAERVGGAVTRPAETTMASATVKGAGAATTAEDGFRGMITAINGEGRTLTVRGVAEERSVAVPWCATVRVNGKPADFGALKVGMFAEVAYSGRDVLHVHAHEEKVRK